MNYEVVIGIEIHAQLNTKSKIFSASPTTFGAAANSQVSMVDAAMPGALPTLNHKVIELAVLFGLSVDADINQRNVFARKNYFYPDLPKGYQISQMDEPIVGKGAITIELPDGSKKSIGITRAHLEEDAGKSIHEGFAKQTGIDLNRAGTPLLEIVSEPDMRSIDEAVAYCKAIHQRVKYLGICDGNMQEGSFRCDINISLRPFGQEAFGTRTELKNLNSFRFIAAAIEHEIERQQDVLSAGMAVTQETRLYDPDADETRAMRSKEDAHDYRYFPDPDLLPVVITDAELTRIRALMPELPEAKRQRYQQDYQLNDKQLNTLTSDHYIADYYEEVLTDHIKPKQAANWLCEDLLPLCTQQQTTLSACPVSTKNLVDLIHAVDAGTISNASGKIVLEALWQQEGSVSDIIAARQLQQMNDDNALHDMITEIINSNPTQVQEYRQGKTKLMAFFVGQVMKASKGKANAAQAAKLLQQALAE